jgi:uncharacterized protein YndB with AHSA1/START domain
MQIPPTLHATFNIERALAHPPDRVFAAFTTPAQKRRWFMSGEHHTAECLEMDFRVGGQERGLSRCAENSPFPNAPITTDAFYLDIIPNRRIVLASDMTIAGKRIIAALLTFEFLEQPPGTLLTCTHQGAYFEGADTPQMREHGWQTLLAKLATSLDA